MAGRARAADLVKLGVVFLTLGLLGQWSGAYRYGSAAAVLAGLVVLAWALVLRLSHR